MTDAQHQNHPLRGLQLINHPIISHPNPAQPGPLAFQLTAGQRLNFEEIDSFDDPAEWPEEL